MSNLTTKNFWNPWAEMDRLFNETALLAPRGLNPREAGFVPACDVEETERAYLFSLDIPGMSRDDLKVELNENRLTIRGERRYEHSEKKNARHLTERYHGSFQRSFALPSKVDAERVEAAYENGVLRVAVPKADAAKTREIKVGETRPGIFTKMS